MVGAPVAQGPGAHLTFSGGWMFVILTWCFMLMLMLMPSN